MSIFLLLWMALIFSLSAQDSTESAALSGGFTYRLFSLIYPDFGGMDAAQQEFIISQFSFIIRKTAHFSIYAVLGVFAFLNAAAYIGLGAFFKSFLAFLFGTAYAVSDEIHQLYISGRSCEVRDIIIDSCGVLLGVTLSGLIYKGVETKMRKKVLLKQNGDLFDRLNDAQGRIAELEETLRQKDYEIENLNLQLEELRSKPQVIAEPETTKAEEPIPECLTEEIPAEEVEIIEDTAPPEQCDACVEEPLIPEIKKCEVTAEPTPVLGNIPDNESIEYGAQTIGKIVLSATQYSNMLTADGQTGYKELLNLILGRTEVAKAEILDITACDSEFSVKKHMIDDVYEQALEYFESVMAQR